MFPSQDEGIVPSNTDTARFASARVSRLQRHLSGVNWHCTSSGNTSMAESPDIFGELDKYGFRTLAFGADGAEACG